MTRQFIIYSCILCFFSSCLFINRTIQTNPIQTERRIELIRKNQYKYRTRYYWTTTKTYAEGWILVKKIKEKYKGGSTDIIDPIKEKQKFYNLNGKLTKKIKLDFRDSSQVTIELNDKGKFIKHKFKNENIFNQ